MSLTLNNIVLGGFTNNDEYYALNDIVWSLQYSICGQNAAQAGICTTLYTGSMSDSNGSLLGGPGKALGVLPSEDYNSIVASGIAGAVLTIAIDSLGTYALADALLPGIGDLYVDGDPLNALNPSVTSRSTYITVRDSLNFVLDAIAIDYDLIASSQSFKTLKFRLTQGGNKLIVSHLNQQNAYEDLATFNVNLNADVATKYKIGITYASPLVTNDAPPARFDVQRFHVQGSTTMPTTAQLTEPLNVLSIPFVNNVSLTIAPSAAPGAPVLPNIPDVDITTLSLTAIAASASYVSLGAELSAFVTSSDPNKRVITYDNNIDI